MSAFISEINVWGSYAGGDFLEIAVPTGTDVSSYEVYVYQSGGTVLSGPWSLGTVVTTIAGQDIYIIDQPVDGISLTYGAGIALVDDVGTVLQFLTAGPSTITATDGPANGMTSTALGHITLGRFYQSEDGSTYTISSTHSKGSIPCFAPGTLIDTPNGLIPVERLRPGVVVSTFDGTPKPIKWIHSRRQACTGDQTPVLIKTGALGPNKPNRDLVVSPQHRILVGMNDQLQGIFTYAALVPAKALVKLPGIRHMRGKRAINWYHFALDPHAVVISNGCATESLLLAKMVVDGLLQVEKVLLRGTYAGPKLKGCLSNGPPAYPCLSVKETKSIIAEHPKPAPRTKPFAEELCSHR